MSSESFSCNDPPTPKRRILTEPPSSDYQYPRVPLFAVASWSSMVSIKLSYFFDPIRDIYEVSIRHVQTRPLFQALTRIGIHNLHFLPTAAQLPRRRAGFDYHDSWPRTSPAPLAPQPRPSASRHLRSSYLPRHQARYPSVRLAETNPQPSGNHNEGNGHIPRGLHRP